MSNRTGLGNRPVRNNEREDMAIRRRLIEHWELQQALRLAGLDLNAASKLAFREITGRAEDTQRKED